MPDVLLPGLFPSRPEPGGTLALDMARVVGVAYGFPRDRVPLVGTIELAKQGGLGAVAGTARNALEPLFDFLQPSHLVLEAPLPLPAQTNFYSAYQQFGLGFIARGEAWQVSCTVFEVSAETARHDVMGQRRFSKDTVKREVLHFVRARGIRTTSFDAADAAILWLYYQQLTNHEPPCAGPLWRRLGDGPGDAGHGPHTE